MMFLAVTHPDSAIAKQLLESLACRLGIGLGRAAIMIDLGGVDADKAQLAPIAQFDGIAVIDVAHRHVRVRPLQRTIHLGQPL